jgi:D-3-phosphoglycerate dehydrogenase
MGRELAEKRIGIVGFGRIGREVATRAHAFGMLAAWCDPFVLQTPSGFQWARRTTLEEMLPESDYLSLHLPLNDETRGMIGAAELAAMKPMAVIVNCARGGLVDEGALFKALQSDALRGAALDVYEAEPPGRHPLFELPSVIATPHLGASTLEAQSRAALEAVEILIEAFGKTAS